LRAAGGMSLMIIELGPVEEIGGAVKLGLFGKHGVARAFVPRARRSADSSLRCASKCLEWGAIVPAFMERAKA
jgi:hypothetical protein